jgi:hypothetical protein
MPASIHAPSLGGRERSTAARLATSGETFERDKAVDTYAQAVVQRRWSLGDRRCPQPMSPSLRRSVWEAVGSAERPVQRDAAGLVPQADRYAGLGSPAQVVRCVALKNGQRNQ